MCDTGVARARRPDARISLGSYETFAEFQLRPGDVLIQKVESAEPLLLECQHLLDCIQSGERPLTEGESGLRVVSVLEAARKSMVAGGAAQSVDPR